MLPRILLLVLLIIYSGSLFVGGVVWQRKNDPDKSRTILANLNNPSSPSYANLMGTLQGKVTKVEGEKIYIEPKKGGQAIFSLSPSVVVSEAKNGEINELGTNKEAIQLNRNMTMTIKGFNNGFAVTSITYATESSPITGQMPELKN
jgi:hypothetical protein